MTKILSNCTKIPRIGEKLTLKVNGIQVNLEVVERTSCKDCYLYNRKEDKYCYSSDCFNFLGNKQGVWLDCGRKYRPDKTNVMFVERE